MDEIIIKQKFKQRKIRQIIIVVLIIPIMILLLQIKKNPDSEIFGLNYDQIGIVSLIIIGAAVIFSFINWRCPNCNKYLGRRMNINNCSNCGAELR